MNIPIFLFPQVLRFFSEVKWLLTLISDPCRMIREAKPRFFSAREPQRDYEFGSVLRVSLSQ